jgi:tRNA nucleotidyltransferase (CCA-adding enzyme)
LEEPRLGGPPDIDSNSQFQDFCNKYNKDYSSSNEYNKRKRQFSDNQKTIQDFNSKQSKKQGYSLEVN